MKVCLRLQPVIARNLPDIWSKRITGNYFGYLKINPSEIYVRWNIDIDALSIIEHHDLLKRTNTINVGIHNITNLLPRPLMRLRSIHITSYHQYVLLHIFYASWLDEGNIFLRWWTAEPAQYLRIDLWNVITPCETLFSLQFHGTISTFIHRSY